MKVGVLGAGHLGKIHIKCIQSSTVLDLVGFFDTQIATAQQVENELHTTAFATVDALIDASDIVVIATPTIYHFALAKKIVEKKKHVFIEKPMTHTVAEAKALMQLVKKYKVQVQVGHVERFNPAFLALGNTPVAPMFIEAHRLANFNPRGTDVSVVLDLMIHDIDLILHWVNAKVKKIHASGVSVVSATPDIANARIEFDNGCVANITASRLSIKQMRKVRLFQPDAYISLDFLEKNAQIIRLLGENTEGGNAMPLETPQGTKWIDISMPDPLNVNAIQMELETFADSIKRNIPPRVTIEDGYKALKVAHQIIKAIGDTTIS
jgi:predicted dehydrogenase